MPLNKDARIEKISELGDSEKVGKHKIEWGGISEYKDVHRVPISYLVYNKYNGRILSRTKSLETQNQKLNTEIAKDFETIEKLLFDSHPSRNRQTEASIRQKGQEKPGIITKDGVVIDGNRRFMFLNRIVNKPEKLDAENFKYFEAVILPVNLADAPDKIRRLETTYQMGEDKKLDYAPIEKYLKAQELMKNGVLEKDIAAWMGETKGEIEKYLNTMKTMDDYLEHLEYDGIYTPLYGREDWFLELTKWLEIFKGEESKKAFDGYKDADVDDLELIFYDYIRAKHGGDGKRFRKIASGQQSNHIFGNKELWDKFRDLHFEKIEPIKDNETSFSLNAQDLKSHLDDRDDKFKKSADEHLKDNLNERISELSNKQNQGRPEKLINKASGALKEVNIKADSFLNLDVQNQLKEVFSTVTELLFQNNVSLVLEQSLKLLNTVDVNALSGEDSSKRLSLVKSINKLSFDMKKQLGG